MLYVIDFLTYIVFYDYQVGKACLLYGLHALKNVVAHVEFASVTVETVARNAYNQVVAQSLGSPQQVDMTLVKQIVCAVCYYFSHFV